MQLIAPQPTLDDFLQGVDLCGGLRSLHRSLLGFPQLATRGAGALLGM